jgi:hypothetical protein
MERWSICELIDTSLCNDDIACAWICRGAKVAASSRNGRCELVAAEPARSMYFGDRVKSQDPDEQCVEGALAASSSPLIDVRDRCATSGTLPCMCKPEAMNCKGVSWPKFASDDGSSFGGQSILARCFHQHLEASTSS